jgi:hypothetical protein
MCDIRFQGPPIIRLSSAHTLSFACLIGRRRSNVANCAYEMQRGIWGGVQGGEKTTSLDLFSPKFESPIAHNHCNLKSKNRTHLIVILLLLLEFVLLGLTIATTCSVLAARGGVSPRAVGDSLWSLTVVLIDN